MVKTIEKSAKNRDEATLAAMRELWQINPDIREEDVQIEVLEKGPKNVFHLAATKEAEHTFQFGPDFADQLRLKKKQMIAAWHDLDDILSGKKPWIE